MNLRLNYLGPVIARIHLSIIIANVEGRQNVLLRGPLHAHRNGFVVTFIFARIAIIANFVKRVC